MEVVKAGAIRGRFGDLAGGRGRILARAVRTIIGVVKLGRPIPGRRDQPGQRWKHLLAETLGHTRMLQWNTIGAAHWFVFVAFGALFFTLLTAYGQLFDPRFALPVIGHWVPYEAASELIAWAGLGSILYLITVRVLSPNRRRTSRFFGSRSWQAYYVEFTILGIVLCVSPYARWSISCSAPRPPDCISRRRGSCCPFRFRYPLSRPRSW